MRTAHKKLIVIHGWGGSYIDAINHIGDLLDFDCHWYHGCFMVPNRSASMLRHLLNVPDPDRFIRALQKLAVSRFIASSPPPAEIDISRDYTEFSEERLRRNFANFGIPVSPTTRKLRSSELYNDAQTALQPLTEIIEKLRSQISAEGGHPPTEKQLREQIKAIAADSGFQEDILPLLEMLREMHENGGDLDTVASAVFYAHHLVSSSKKKLAYGRDYQFVFINYHESMLHLTQYAPAEVYMADLPIGAFPNLEDEIAHLHDNGIQIVRFEDHHPYPAERQAKLEQLVAEHKLGFLALSGPLINQELDQETEPQCGADMVYNNLIKGSPADCPAAIRLRKAAHGEDFVTNRTPFGILLTDLIKGGICKTELAQILLAAMEHDDGLERLTLRGWAQLPELWHKDIDEVAQTLTENVLTITLAKTGTKIVAALAMHAEPGKPRLTTGKAVEFFARTYPDADYIFYCFGASILVARRLNHANTDLNLGSLMPLIGSDGDGGHSGAAVCRPDANPSYPSRLLGRINSANFSQFAHYLGDVLTANDYAVASIENLSTATPNRWSSGRRNVAIILLVALIAGLLLTLFFPAFRPANARKSNQGYFHQYVPSVPTNTLTEMHKP
jgi:hypothetical protein